MTKTENNLFEGVKIFGVDDSNAELSNLEEILKKYGVPVEVYTRCLINSLEEYNQALAEITACTGKVIIFIDMNFGSDFSKDAFENIVLGKIFGGVPNGNNFISELEKNKIFKDDRILVISNSNGGSVVRNSNFNYNKNSSNVPKAMEVIREFLETAG